MLCHTVHRVLAEGSLTKGTPSGIVHRSAPVREIGQEWVGPHLQEDPLPERPVLTLPCSATACDDDWPWPRTSRRCRRLGWDQWGSTWGQATLVDLGCWARATSCRPCKRRRSWSSSQSQGPQREGDAEIHRQMLNKQRCNHVLGMTLPVTSDMHIRGRDHISYFERCA